MKTEHVGGAEPPLLAIDGGNSKTDLVLVRSDGSLVAFVRGSVSSPHQLGVDGCLRELTRLFDEACSQAGLRRTDGPLVAVAEVLLAGLDLPAEEQTLRDLIHSRGWATRTIVGNDTFALLRLGTEHGWGVAVVCGAGINCVGVAPDGRHARFAALGPITGDWGGGLDVGLAALSAAARSEDGRGPLTALEQAVPAHFGLGKPFDLAKALHLKQIPMLRLAELAPVVLALAADDPVSAAIVDRLAAEVVAFARAALTRLDLTEEPVEVILGGGLLRSGDSRLLAAIEAGLHEVGPQITACVSAASPIVGAALLALDEFGAGEAAQKRLLRELGDAEKSYDTHSGRNTHG
jgi:N-acetylglucosamine kinase-like BadF-type ATPase